MPIKHVAFTMYPVSDMARAVEFYRDKLGLTQAGLNHDFWVEFDIGGSTFGIGNFEQCGEPGSSQALAIEVADLEALRDTLAQRGVETSEPTNLAACTISMVKDPDGNQIWLHQIKPS